MSGDNNYDAYGRLRLRNPKIKEGSRRYKELLEEAFELHLAKNQGYSAQNPDAFANFRLAKGMGLTPVQGVLVRLGDKFARVQSLAKNPENDMVGESMRDTLMDLSAYALIAVCLMEEQIEASIDRTEPEHCVCREWLGPKRGDVIRSWEDEPVSEPMDAEKFINEVLDEPEMSPSFVGKMTCYNRSADGVCLGHPVKNGPYFHADDVEVEMTPGEECCKPGCAGCGDHPELCLGCTSDCQHKQEAC
jgi:hypothetical protein